MTQKHPRTYRRPRLDPVARERLMAEIAKFDVPPVSVQIARTMRELRATLAVPIEAVPIEDEDAAVAAENASATADPDGAHEIVTVAPVPPEIRQPPLKLIRALPELPEALPTTAATPETPAEAPHTRHTPAPSPDTAPEITSEAAPMPARNDLWHNLRRVPIDAGLLDRNLVITAGRTDPAHASFDVMRTRLVQALAEKGWKRVAITSPTKGCGKSFTAVNLAITLSRYQNSRTILLDMDLRHPAAARYLGASNVGSMGDVLRGETSMADHLRRPGENALNIGSTLAFGLNDRPEKFASELFQQPTTGQVLRRMQEEFQPNVVLYDLPPALAYDDVIAFRPQFDCVLMVIGGGITSAKEVNEVHRRLGEDKPVLGVILNMAEDDEDNTY